MFRIFKFFAIKELKCKIKGNIRLYFVNEDDETEKGSRTVYNIF